MSDVLTTGDRLETLQQDLAEVAQLRPEVAELMETACRIVATALRIFIFSIFSPHPLFSIFLKKTYESYGGMLWRVC
ncbi:hypothetical protein HY213_04035 [Candidatus Peregrinibacteria bacterium]|nr:hypothetical protein [Candidatus Peregrinibacteria bacterium]